MEGTWTEHSTPDGRKYWYNSATQKSVWTKPAELSTPSERALANQPWKEYTAEGGRKYYHNATTNATVWEMPDVYREALEQAAPSQPANVAAPAFVAGGASSLPQYPPQRTRDELIPHDGGRHAERQERFNQNEPVRANFVVATSNDPEYSTYEEAEAAFMKLLKRSNVQPDWTWEQTMRAIIKDPQYRSLKDPKERKAAFEKYVVEARIQDKEREKERLVKLRSDFVNMLKSHPEIKHYTRWKTARPIIEGETIFRSASDDTERRQLFEDYIVQLKGAHAENEASTRKAALDDLVLILNALNLEPYTRWADAESIIDSDDRFKSDDKFKTLTKSDVLTAFENHVKSLERTFNDARQLEKTLKSRRERQNRDSFMSLLKDLRTAGRIKAGTKWMDIHALIESDERYVSMLGQPGSTPLDLFWDVVEEEERALRGKRSEVLDVLDDKRFEITPKTQLEEFMLLMRSDRRTSSVDPDDLSLIFTRLLDKIVKRDEEDKHNLERHQRRTVDALRSRIKHLEPPVRVSDSWEEVRPRIERSEEYRSLNSEDLARSAFDKVIRRLREKDAEVEQRERTRRADRVGRDARSNGSRHGGTRRSRTPENDPYEADRRRAVAERERQYSRKASNGLSPPRGDPRRREPRDRDERNERDGSRSRRSHDSVPFERERRDRGLERERSYISRADPRDSGARELDYGESGAAGSANGASSSRRRRGTGDDEDDSKRESKRVKTDDAAKTPVEATPIKEAEEEALKSGSEEGEIEED